MAPKDRSELPPTDSTACRGCSLREAFDLGELDLMLQELADPSVSQEQKEKTLRAMQRVPRECQVRHKKYDPTAESNVFKNVTARTCRDTERITLGSVVLKYCSHQNSKYCSTPGCKETLLGACQAFVFAHKIPDGQTTCPEHSSRAWPFRCRAHENLGDLCVATPTVLTAGPRKRARAVVVRARGEEKACVPVREAYEHGVRPVVEREDRLVPLALTCETPKTVVGEDEDGSGEGSTEDGSGEGSTDDAGEDADDDADEKSDVDDSDVCLWSEEMTWSQLTVDEDGSEGDDVDEEPEDAGGNVVDMFRETITSPITASELTEAAGADAAPAIAPVVAAARRVTRKRPLELPAPSSAPDAVLAYAHVSLVLRGHGRCSRNLPLEHE